jgi:uncharacterized protein YceH (UPF0502 family)
MTTAMYSDATLAITAGLTRDERWALDALADRDPRLSRPALYENARSVADAMSAERLDAEERARNAEARVEQLEAYLAALRENLATV